MVTSQKIAAALVLLALGGGAGLACGDTSDRLSNDAADQQQQGTAPTPQPTGGTAPEDATPPAATATVGTLPAATQTTGSTAP